MRFQKVKYHIPEETSASGPGGHVHLVTAVTERRFVPEREDVSNRNITMVSNTFFPYFLKLCFFLLSKKMSRSDIVQRNNVQRQNEGQESVSECFLLFLNSKL